MKLLAVLAAVSRAAALHFYMNENEEPRCIQLDLGRDALFAEKHSAWEWEAASGGQDGHWVRDDTLKVEVTIDELFDKNHRVYSHKLDSFGQVQFNALDGGEHRICYRALSNGWFSKNRVKLEIDYTVGTGDLLDSRQEGRVGGIIDRIGDINRKLIYLNQEQTKLRDREAAFRDQSEAANSRVSRLTLFQLAVLVATCAWQVNHLRGFFTKQKLV